MYQELRPRGLFVPRATSSWLLVLPSCPTLRVLQAEGRPPQTRGEPLEFAFFRRLGFTALKHLAEFRDLAIFIKKGDWGIRPVDWGPLQEEADMMSLRLFAVFALCLAAADGFQLAGTHRLAGRSPRLLLCSAACGVCTLARCGDRVQLARRLMRVALAQRLQLRGPCANRPVRSSQWCRPRSSTRHPPTPPRSLRARALEFQGRVRGCAVRLTSA